MKEKRKLGFQTPGELLVDVVFGRELTQRTSCADYRLSVLFISDPDGGQQCNGSLRNKTGRQRCRQRGGSMLGGWFCGASGKGFGGRFCGTSRNGFNYGLGSGLVVKFCGASGG